MVSQEIVSRVNGLMNKGFEIPMEKLTPTATLFDELGLDSLDAIDMLVHLEENLKIKVDAKRLTGVRTLQDVYELVSSLITEGASTSQPNAQVQVSQ